MNNDLYESVAHSSSTSVAFTADGMATVCTCDQDLIAILLEAENMYPEVEELSYEDGVLVVRMPKDWLVIGPEEEDD